jgi:hypothetical protein
VIRKATLADVPAIVDIAVESVNQNPLPVRICRESMADTAREAIAGNQHFVWVSEIDGEVVAAVGAMSERSFWYERQQCSMMLYYTRAPGEGVKLLREFGRWVKARPVIKVAVIEMEPDADPRLIKLINRIGFSRLSMNCTYVRGQA